VTSTFEGYGTSFSGTYTQTIQTQFGPCTDVRPQTLTLQRERAHARLASDDEHEHEFHNLGLNDLVDDHDVDLNGFHDLVDHLDRDGHGRCGEHLAARAELSVLYGGGLPVQRHRDHAVRHPVQSRRRLRPARHR
jgi:hypothetical protein